jgi:hypothetical protein
MAIPHHESDQNPLLQRFRQELEGTAPTEYPHGKCCGEDEGLTVFKIATDRAHGVIRIEYSQPMKWVGLDLDAAIGLRDQLNARIKELTGP